MKLITIKENELLKVEFPCGLIDYIKPSKGSITIKVKRVIAKYIEIK